MTTITVIWTDQNNNDLNDFHVQELELEWTLDQIKKASISLIVQTAMLELYSTDNTRIDAVDLTVEALKGYGLIGVVHGSVEWIH